MANVLLMHLDDNVVNAVVDLPQGAPLALDGHADLGVVALEPIPFGHKVAIAPIARGERVVKYGASIGIATADIAPGQHVHTHNLRSVRGAAKR